MTDDTICVHGLGHIGLPTAAVLADAGYRVFGYDVDEDVRRVVRHGELPFEEAELGTLVSAMIKEGALEPVDECVPADYHLICVPTPLDKSARKAELSHVTAAASTIASVLREDDTVIVESTVPPGTTVGTVKPVLESTGMDAEADFWLAYSPETVLPGRVLAELRSNDRLIGGVGPDSTASAVELYESFVDGDVHRTDATTAEFVKLAQNTYRDVNVALANEFAQLARELDVDPRAVVALGNTHPRVDIHDPGPGTGGHCLPVDPWFLCQRTDRATLIERARQVNDEMVSYVADIVGDVVDLPTSRITILGLAYKGGVADTRHSPGVRLVEELRERGARDIQTHDPHASIDIFDHSDSITSNGRASVSPDGGSGSVLDAVSGSDVLVVTADHAEYADQSPAEIGREMRSRTLIDTKDVLDHEEWRENGFTVSTI